MQVPGRFVRFPRRGPPPSSACCWPGAAAVPRAPGAARPTRGTTGRSSRERRRRDLAVDQPGGRPGGAGRRGARGARPPRPGRPAVRRRGAAGRPRRRGRARRSGVGGVFLAGRSQAPAEDIAAVTERWQAASPGPGVWVAVDQEGGAVQSLKGPGSTGCRPHGTRARCPPTSSPRSPRASGRRWPRRGVNLDLAPVVDVVPPGTEAGNAPIGAYGREYGGTPEAVTAAAGTIVDGPGRRRGHGDAEALPGTGPGERQHRRHAVVHDAVTTADDPQLTVFSTLADSPAAPFVMASSAIYDRIDGSKQAMFSPVVLTDVLRGQLGFDGVVISDDVGNADAVSGVPVGERAVRFLGAGGTLVLTVEPTSSSRWSTPSWPAPRTTPRSPRWSTPPSGPRCWPRPSRTARVAQAPTNSRRRSGVADGVAVPVVVEVGVDVAAVGRPLPDAVGPPAQVGVGVGAGVEVPGVRAVQPDVDERRGGPQHARQAGAAHHAVRRPVALQQREDRLVVPAGMAELHGHPHPVRQPGEQVVEPGVVALVLRVQLDQQHRPPVAELVPRRGQPRQPRLGRVEPLGVGEPARRLHRQLEPLGQPAPPAREARVPGPAVEAGVELDRAEARRT